MITISRRCKWYSTYDAYTHTNSRDKSKKEFCEFLSFICLHFGLLPLLALCTNSFHFIFCDCFVTWQSALTVHSQYHHTSLYLGICIVSNLILFHLFCLSSHWNECQEYAWLGCFLWTGNFSLNRLHRNSNSNRNRNNNNNNNESNSASVATPIIITVNMRTKEININTIRFACGKRNRLSVSVFGSVCMYNCTLLPRCCLSCLVRVSCVDAPMSYATIGMAMVHRP